MKQGILLYALNNEQIDYVEIAYYAAQQAKKHLKLPVAIVTDSADWLYKKFPNYKEIFDMVIKIVHETSVEKWQSNKFYGVGNLAFYNGTIWRKVKEGNEVSNVITKKYNINLLHFNPVYKGIDIDKWYPNLPYLKGQHVWYDNILYRCNNDYEESNEFSIDKYDVLIKNVIDHASDLKPKIGDIVLHNRTLWQKKKPIEIEFNSNHFDPVYKGIDIDKWYPNLPYLKGQHVWYDNILYRCEVGYTESDSFTKNKYIVLLENIKEINLEIGYLKGDIYFHNRSLLQANTNLVTEFVSVSYDTTNLDPVYEGIDIDKWYPNLPYLKGQHVWYDNILYRCNNDYEESDEFSIDNYDVILKNVKDLIFLEKFNIGDILLHNRVLWMSQVNYDSTLNEDKIRDDIWEDTKERHLVYTTKNQYRNYYDGALSSKRLSFKNDIRIKSFELSPFDETLVIDCDYYINNDTLKYCWQQPHDFLIFKEAFDLSGYRYDPRLHTLSDKSIDFYWATVFFFKKTKNTEIFFNYLGHIQENWNYYRYVYQIQNAMYRNDFSFSIAIHVMNGHQKGSWANPIPGKLYYTIDRDIILEYTNEEMKFLIEKEKYKGQYTLLKTRGLNIHVMNKFSLSRLFNEAQYV
jgi:hypothetical protein